MEIGLEDGAVLGIDGKKQQFALRCLTGYIWLTRTDDQRDYILAAGEQMEFRRHDSVVVEAWGAARLLCVISATTEQEPGSAPAWHLVSLT